MNKSHIEKVKTFGDVPTARFGHSFNMVSSNKAILFGGAVSLAGKFVITNETYLFDFVSNKWKKLSFSQGFVPSERAAHAATMVSEMQMVIYGGAASGTQGLLKDELYILDIRRQPVWKIIEVANKTNTPGQRYGHTMVFSKPYLVVFGGNSGNKAQNDVWILNILRGPFNWMKYEFPNSNVLPCPRVYHSAAICEEGSAFGMMVVFGGRKQTKKDHNGSQRQLKIQAMNDIWGLRKHRDGTWDWVTPPKSTSYTPLNRYQHLVCFMGSMLVIMGGRSNSSEQNASTIQIYDTQTSQWHRVNCVSRYRHAIAMYDKSKLFIHGGFQPQFASQPLQSMISVDLSSIFTKSNNNVTDIENRLANMSLRNGQKQMNETSGQKNLRQIQSEKTKQDFGKRQLRGLRQMKQSEKNIINSRLRIGTSNLQKSKLERQRDLTPSRIINSSKQTRLSNQVIVATSENNTIQIQKVPVNSLMEESKRLANQESQDFGDLQNITSLQLADSILSYLLPTSNGMKNPISNLFPFKRDKLLKLCQQVMKIVANETSLLCLRAPTKVFGSLYGRYSDLLKFFENFGIPDDRQMEAYEYVFLGNYVDKGVNSLQTICLIFSLKIKYPQHIKLLRGRHQDINVNKICGFAEECSLRLGQNFNDPNSVFNAFNAVFDMLPLAAAIDDRFLCINGGLGNVNSLIDIKNVERPVNIAENEIAKNLLWSEQNGNEHLKYSCKKTDFKQLETFLDENNLDSLICTKDGIANGIEDNGGIIYVSSVTNYPGTHSKGSILKINKNLSIAPCLIEGIPNRKGGLSSWMSDVVNKGIVSLSQTEKQLRKTMFQKV